MAYRLLLIGNDNNTKDLFFDKMGEDFFCISSSRRSKDLKWHVDAFKPDAIVYCMLDEDVKYFGSIANNIKGLLGSGKHFILVGDEKECESFQKNTGNSAHGTVSDPETANQLKDDIVAIIENRFTPAAKADTSQGSSDNNAWANILSQIDAEAGTERKHILVVDDDPLMLKVIKDYLHDDYEVATAKSGAIAHKFLEKKRTDLILLDYEMPGEKGPEVLTKLREIPGAEKVPVIFLTGVKDKERLVEIVKVKPQGYLSKPVERQALFDMINKIMV